MINRLRWAFIVAGFFCMIAGSVAAWYAPTSELKILILIICACLCVWLIRRAELHAGGDR